MAYSGDLVLAPVTGTSFTPMMSEAAPGPFSNVTSFELAKEVRSEFSTKVRIAASSQRTTILTFTLGGAADAGLADATGFGLAATNGLELVEGDALCPSAPDTNNINNRKLSPGIFLFI
jgi:hypothetical protein